MHQPAQDKHFYIIYTAKSAVIVALAFVLCGLIFVSSCFIGDTDNSQVVRPKIQGTATINRDGSKSNAKGAAPMDTQVSWTAPSLDSIPSGEAGKMIRYGRELIAHTGKYFGPKGTIAAVSNGMNCQNCHLEGGTRLFANNYGGFYANYPKKGARSGKLDQVTDRISDCFQRSLNGRMPEKSSKEIKAMIAWFKWVGQGVKKGDKLRGAATEKLPFLDRPADPKKGLLVYRQHCGSCHGEAGAGQLAKDGLTYVYPPLWGSHSYSDGAGMYRLSNFAGFVKNNMPFGVDRNKPILSNEQAWDVAAYVNSRPRPHREQAKDYPDLSKKPIDAPYGPYQDEFSELQHKYGPYNKIITRAKELVVTQGSNRAHTGG